MAKLDNGYIKPIDPEIRNFITRRNLYVLRDAKTGYALNTSYTPEGLYWTTNVSGKLLYFRNAYFKTHYENEVPVRVSIAGDTRPSNKVFIEKFSPKNQNNIKGQMAEYTLTNKATWLLHRS